MPSTYSPSLRLELIGDGDQPGNWGRSTNVNLGTLIEGAIAGYATVSVTSANQALTASNGAADQARLAAIQLTTTTTANFAVYAPPAPKQYTIYNNTNYTATIYNSTVLGSTTAAGTGVAIPAGKTMTVWSDGANFRVRNSHFIGTVVGEVTGNASTATTLQTARTINGVSFNGSANITLTASTPNAVTFNDSGTGAVSGATFDGSTAQTISYNTVGAPSTTGANASGTWGISISGNASTATTANTVVDGAITTAKLNDGAVTVVKGGTGATTQAGALANLGVPLSNIVELSANYTVTSADRGKHFRCSGVVTITLPTTASVGAGFAVSFTNSGSLGSSVVSLVPNGFEGLEGSAGVKILFPQQSTTIVSNGAGQWDALGSERYPNVLGVRSMSIGTAPSFYDTIGIEIGSLCRAWVNFTGTGTVIRNGSVNVSSVADLGTGVYRVYFVASMPGPNYAVAGSARRNTTNGTGARFEVASNASSLDSSYVEVVTTDASGVVLDCDRVLVAVFS